MVPQASRFPEHPRSRSPRQATEVPAAADLPPMTRRPEADHRGQRRVHVQRPHGRRAGVHLELRQDHPWHAGDQRRQAVRDLKLSSDEIKRDRDENRRALSATPVQLPGANSRPGLPRQPRPDIREPPSSR